MAVFVYTDAHLTINSVDISDHVRSLTTNFIQETPDSTAMSATARTKAVGLKDANFTVEFNSDFAATETDATLWAIWNGGAAITFAIRPDSAVKGATNPEYRGSAILKDWTPLSGNVGDMATVSATFEVTGPVTRSTS